MRKKLKKYFIPHEENNFAPHLLREVSISVLALVSLVAFLGSAAHVRLFLTNEDFLAAVLPDVLVDLANEDRAENAIAPLRANTLLEEAARLKVEDMAAKGYFAHTSPDGVTPWHWFIESGYEFSAAGENLAVNFSDSEDVENAWMDSPGHRANILNDTFTEVGVATARGEYKGRETVFVVQLFGRPLKTPLALQSISETIAADSGRRVLVPEVESDSAGPGESPHDLTVIAEDDLFIAVVDENASAGETPAIRGEETEGVLSLDGARTSLWDRLFSQPRQILAFIYALIAVGVTVALILAVAMETERQHPKHVLYGVLILLLLSALFYINRVYLFGELFVV